MNAFEWAFILLGKSYVLYNSYGGHDFAERIKITYQIRPKWGELFSKKNKSYVTCIRDTRVQVIKSARGNDHLLTEDNHRYRI